MAQPLSTTEIHKLQKMKCSTEKNDLSQKIVIEIFGQNTQPRYYLRSQCNFKIPTKQSGRVYTVLLILD